MFKIATLDIDIDIELLMSVVALSQLISKNKS